MNPIVADTATRPVLALRALWAEGFDLELALMGAGLLVLIFAGFWVVMRVRDYQKEEQADRLSPQQLLEQYRDMLDQGLLEPQEFEKLQKQLGVRASLPPKAAEPPDKPAP